MALHWPAPLCAITGREQAQHNIPIRRSRRRTWAAQRQLKESPV